MPETTFIPFTCLRLKFETAPEKPLHPCGKLSDAPESLLHPCGKLSDAPEKLLHPCNRNFDIHKCHFAVKLHFSRLSYPVDLLLKKSFTFLSGKQKFVRHYKNIINFKTKNYGKVHAYFRKSVY